MKRVNLKNNFLSDHKELNTYLNKIGFSIDQVISIETQRIDDSLVRYIFKGIGFIFAVESFEQRIFKPKLEFNEIETQAG